jgi:hypothetical protein
MPLVSTLPLASSSMTRSGQGAAAGDHAEGRRGDLRRRQVRARRAAGPELGDTAGDQERVTDCDGRCRGREHEGRLGRRLVRVRRRVLQVEAVAEPRRDDALNARHEAADEE